MSVIPRNSILGHKDTLKSKIVKSTGQEIRQKLFLIGVNDQEILL